MTADEFERKYAERSGVTVDELRKTQVVLPCACGEQGLCRGWAVVANEPAAIKAHMKLYAPKA